MANEPKAGPKTGSAYTPPKGRATASRDSATGRSSSIPPMLQWLMVAIVLAAIVAIAWFFSSPGSGGHSGLPAAGDPAPVVALAAET